MKKVLSCKVRDELYNIVDSLPDSHSTVLRKAIIMYLKSIKISERNKSIPVVYQQTDTNEYKSISHEINDFYHYWKKDKKE